MQINFVIGNEIKYSAKINESREELFKDLYNINRSKDQVAQNKQKFKIPINVK